MGNHKQTSKGEPKSSTLVLVARTPEANNGMTASGRTATIQLDAPSDCKQTSRFCLLCHFQRIVDFDAKVSHRAFQLGMSEKELNCPKVLRTPVDQRRLGSAHGVRAIRRRV